MRYTLFILLLFASFSGYAQLEPGFRAQVCGNLGWLEATDIAGEHAGLEISLGRQTQRNLRWFIGYSYEIGHVFGINQKLIWETTSTTNGIDQQSNMLLKRLGILRFQMEFGIDYYREWFTSTGVFVGGATGTRQFDRTQYIGGPYYLYKMVSGTETSGQLAKGVSVGLGYRKYVSKQLELMFHQRIDLALSPGDQHIDIWINPTFQVGLIYRVLPK